MSVPVATGEGSAEVMVAVGFCTPKPEIWTADAPVLGASGVSRESPVNEKLSVAGLLPPVFGSKRTWIVHVPPSAGTAPVAQDCVPRL